MQQTNVSRVVQGGEAKDVLDSIRQIIRSLRVASRAAEKELGLSSCSFWFCSDWRAESRYR